MRHPPTSLLFAQALAQPASKTSRSKQITCHFERVGGEPLTTYITVLVDYYSINPRFRDGSETPAWPSESSPRRAGSPISAVTPATYRESAKSCDLWGRPDHDPKNRHFRLRSGERCKGIFRRPRSSPPQSQASLRNKTAKMTRPTPRQRAQRADMRSPTRRKPL